MFLCGIVCIEYCSFLLWCDVVLNTGLSKPYVGVNSKIVNLLDITFDLDTGLYKPYMKDNDGQLYVDTIDMAWPLSDLLFF